MELTKKIIVAIDGFSSCGKSTFAKLIANELNYIFIDTGAMYRSVSLFALQNKLAGNGHIDVNTLVRLLPEIRITFRQNANGKTCTFLNDVNVEDAIRGVEVSKLVSEVSKIKQVRQHLVALQQNMGKEKGIVMDGRDIGTVVFPNAEIKLFMTAGKPVRAQRRFDELRAKGFNVSLDEILRNIEERDYIDMNRKESPLRKAADAIELDNSNMGFEEQMLWFRNLLVQKNLIA
ncbi:MAG: (d)CMP kinase [Bacteroidales bacterium]|nr:(d)CMP kinase [Bacteroidales bacterium]